MTNRYKCARIFNSLFFFREGETMQEDDLMPSSRGRELEHLTGHSKKVIHVCMYVYNTFSLNCTTQNFHPVIRSTWVKGKDYFSCRCLYLLCRAPMISPSSVHAVSLSSLGKLSFSITRLWHLPAVKGLQK